MATHYVLASASGAGTGVDWTNAYTVLPATGTLVRGDTYYLGVGSYPAYIFNDVQSGTSVITIKKATVADHGPASDWNVSFAGQSEFAATVEFLRGYYVFDGQTRNESDWFDGTAYGLKVTVTTDIRGIWSHRQTALTPDIRIQYVYVQSIATTPANPVTVARHGISSDNQAGLMNTGFVVSRCYVYGSIQPFFPRTTDGAIIEYSASKNAMGGPAPFNHGEVVNLFFSANRAVVRFNKFIDAYLSVDGSTAVVSIFQCVGARVYGNLMSNFRCGNCAIGFRETVNQTSDILVYNNTIDQCRVFDVGKGGVVLGADNGDNYAYNNLWTNCSGGIALVVNHDYNVFPDAVSAGEAHEQLNATDAMYANYAGGDFRLVAPTDPGLTLPAPYNTDINGVARALDGVWDRGAYEYDSSPSSPPSTVTGRVLRWV